MTFLKNMNWNLADNLFEFDREDSKGQQIFRRIFELFIVLATINLAWYWGEYTLRISDIVLPLGLARYIDISFMHGNQLPIWNAGAITGLVAIGFFRLGRWPYALAFVLLVLQYSARFTLGEIPHSSNLVGMGLLGFALGRLCFPDETSQGRFSIGFSYFFIGLGYTSAAISKLIATGITWPSGKHLWMWINEKAVDEIARSGFVELNIVQEAAMASFIVATLFLAFGLIAEALAWLVWYKKTRMLLMLGILALHIGIWMTMDILFALSVYELLILTFPWAVWIDRFLDKRGST